MRFPATSAPSRLTASSIAARIFCLCVVSAQLYAVVHAYRDPLKRFGYQPFAESTTWRARIFAVDAAGERRDVSNGWSGYRWQDLVKTRARDPFREHTAPSGIRASLFFLQHALDYVADHTPRDTRTRYLEASVSYRKNRRPEQHVSLRSKPRPVAWP